MDRNTAIGFIGGCAFAGCLAGTLGLAGLQPEVEPADQSKHIKSEVISADRVVFWDSLVLGSRERADRYVSIQREDDDSMHLELQHQEGYYALLNARGLFFERSDLHRSVGIEAAGITIRDTESGETIANISFDQIIEAMKE